MYHQFCPAECVLQWKLFIVEMNEAYVQYVFLKTWPIPK